MVDLNECEECYKAEVPACTPEIYIEAAVPVPLFYYTIIITDKFNRQYVVLRQADGLGNFPLHFDTEGLPAGLLNEASGELKIEIKEAQNSCDALTMTFCGQPYKCILLKPVAGSRFSSGLEIDYTATSLPIPCNCVDIELSNLSWNCLTKRMQFDYTISNMPQHAVVLAYLQFEQGGSFANSPSITLTANGTLTTDVLLNSLNEGEHRFRILFFNNKVSNTLIQTIDCP